MQALINAALDHFAIPGDVSFPLNQAFEAPRDRQDAETLRQYVKYEAAHFDRIDVSDSADWIAIGTSRKSGRKLRCGCMRGYTPVVLGLPRYVSIPCNHGGI